MARSLNKHKRFNVALIGLTILALVLSACNTAPPTPPPPTNTPTNTVFRDVENDLFYTIDYPAGWQKIVVDAKTREYTAPLPDTKMTIAIETFDRVLPDNRSVVERVVRDRRNRFRQVSEEPGGNLVIPGLPEITFTKLKYNTGRDVVEYVSQINVVTAGRAYLLLGLTLATNEETYRPLFFKSFESLTLFPPAAPTQAATAIVNPTVIAAQQGGVVQPRQGFPPDTSIRRVPLVNWTTPPLNNNLIAFNSTFPANWQWRLVRFPKPENFGIVMNAPFGGPVGGSSSEATIQVGIVENAFDSDAPPTLQRFEQIMLPYIEYYNFNTLANLGTSVQILPPSAAQTATTPNVTPRPAAQISSVGVQRSPFVVRDSNGSITTRGAIYGRQIGRNLIMSTVLLSSGAAINETINADYDAAMLKLMNNIKVETSRPVIN